MKYEIILVLDGVPNVKSNREQNKIGLIWNSRIKLIKSNF